VTDKPYLIVPPPGLIAPATPPAEVPVAAEPYIAPPSVVVESGTHRMSPAVARTPPPLLDHAQSDTITIRPTVAWRLDLPHGLPSVAVTGTAVLGRNPAAIAAIPDAALVSIADPAKSVSKTHLLVEVDGEGLWITDLDSTNGTVTVSPTGVQLVLEPRVRSRVADGSAVSLGEFTMRALRR